EDLPLIFNRFYRVDKARTRDEGGSGLGLSICRQIAEAHKGKNEVESKLGVGTRFKIRLPNLAC
ncbi:MAG: signal transduction histidine kinase, partial [Nitrospinales bacterium]